MVSVASNTQVHGVSLGDVGARKLRALGAALGVSDALVAQALHVFELMSEPWRHWAVGDAPIWPNDISDDGTPFEFSASFDGSAPRLRMLTESQSDSISSTSSWDAGLALGQRLKDCGLADLTLFDEIRSLFVPPAGARARFTLWHAAVLEDGHPALFKAYVNPCLLGIGAAPYVVEQALRRLGFEAAWHFLEQRLRTAVGAEIRYFSVDLENPATARVKVYLGISKSAVDVDQLIAGGRNVQPGDAQRWLDALTLSQGPFDVRPVLSCFSFRRGFAEPDVTVHVPIRCYVKHDAEAVARVSTLVAEADQSHLTRALAAVSNRPLDVGRGLLTYASLRREAARTRLTVYLAPEVYSITSRRQSTPPVASDLSSGVHKTTPRSVLDRSHMGDVQSLVARQEKLFRAQPLLRHLETGGTVAQAQALVEHLSLLLVWLQDLLRFAREGGTDPVIVSQLSECSSTELARGQAFIADAGALGVRCARAAPLTDLQRSMREVAFSRIAEVISATYDPVRLAMVLAVSATCQELLSAALDFVARAVGQKGAEPRNDLHRFDADSQPRLEMIALVEESRASVFAATERCFESMLVLAAATDRAVFGA